MSRWLDLSHIQFHDTDADDMRASLLAAHALSPLPPSDAVPVPDTLPIAASAPELTARQHFRLDGKLMLAELHRRLSGGKKAFDRSVCERRVTIVTASCSHDPTF